MKKIKLLLTLMLIAIVSPLVVLADVGAPETSRYNVIVTNNQGAYEYEYEDGKYSKTDRIIPIDNKLEVMYEFESKGDLYLYVEYKNSGTIIKATDVTAEKGIVEKHKIDNPHYLYAYEDTKVYEGPSIAFKEVGTIPAGSDIVIKEITDSYLWGYVEYKDIKGYVYVVYNTQGAYQRPCTLAKKNINNRKIKLKKDELYVYSIPSSDENDSKRSTIELNLKAGQEIEYDYVYLETFSKYYHITVDGVSGWIKAESVLNEPETTKYLVLFENVKAYAKQGDKSSIKHNLQLNKAYEVIYEYIAPYNCDEEWYLIKEENQEYWIKGESCGESYDFIIFSYKVRITLTEETKYYEDYYSENPKELGTLEPGTYDAYYQYEGDYYYIVDKGYVLWKDVDPTVVEVITKPEVVPTEKEGKEDKKGKSTDIKKLVIYCVAGALILCLTGIVTMRLINRKNKKEVVSQMVQQPMYGQQPVEENKEEKQEESK